jgi:hypothetical protein
MSALSLAGAVQNQYSQVVLMQHMTNERYAVEYQCSIFQTFLFTHFNTTVWNCGDCF